MKVFKSSILLLTAICIINIKLFSQSSFNMTPPMGWEPWNIDHCGGLYKWDEAYYKKLADFFVNSGLRDLSYKYLTIECNSQYRDKNGDWQADTNTFPNGIEPVIKYIHDKGLMVRTYTDAGRNVCCCNIMGSYSHYYEDAQRWVDLGFDGVKIDWCGGKEQNLDPKTQYLEFKRAVDKTGKKDFNIEICSWGEGNPCLWGRNAGQIWRTSGDIDCELVNGQWNFTIGGSWNALKRNIDSNRHPKPEYSGPGIGWNYADMLVVGVPGGLNALEERTQFSMWAIMASPLFLGNDVFNMSDSARNTIMNKEIIEIDQDKSGIQGDVVKEFNDGQLQIWYKPLADGSVALALFNRSDIDNEITVNFTDLKMAAKCKVRDIWNNKDFTNVKEKYTSKVKAHEAVILKISEL